MSLTIENSLPGVTALVNEGQVSRPFQRQPTSTLFVIGFAAWGAAGVPVVVTSFNDFTRKFGGFHSLGYLADAAKVFFDHFGGSQIIAMRAVDAGTASKSSVTINKADATDGFNFDSKYFATADVDISIVVSAVDGDAVNKRNLTVVSKYLNIREVYEAVDLRNAETRTLINENSKLISAALVGAAIAGADGLPEVGVFALTGGTDGAADFDTTTFGAYLEQFADENLGTGQVAIPGFSNAANNAALIAHAEQYNRLAILDTPFGVEATDLDFSGSVSSYAAVYYPWVQMQALDNSGVKKFYPPSIFAAAACAKVDRTVGTHKVPANINIPLALDVERNADGTSVINDGSREFLNRNNINAIAPLTGEGIKIYGGRVLAPAGDTRIRFVHERRILNLIYYTAKIGYKFAVFSVVDAEGRLFRDLRSTGTTFLRNLWNGGALFGRTEQEAFIVIADASNNPPEELANGRVHVQLGVKLSPTAEVIFVNIDSIPLSESLNVLTGGEI